MTFCPVSYTHLDVYKRQGLAEVFDARKDSWHKEYQELKELLPEAEYEAARASTLTSYYTSPEIIRAMYSTLERFGLQGGNILEPSMGVGAFFANRPASFDASANLFGVELDPVTGRIAKQLYPKANIQICGYEKAVLPDSYFDAVIGNVPFGQYKVCLLYTSAFFVCSSERAFFLYCKRSSYSYLHRLTTRRTFWS